MRIMQLFAAGLVLASALFMAIMLVAPPTSDAAAAFGEAPAASPPLELVGP